MEKAINIIFAVISVGIAILIIHNILEEGKKDLNKETNKRALEILHKNIIAVCKTSKFDGKVAVIDLTPGIRLYTEEDRICYTGNEVRCKLSECELNPMTIINLTSDFAKESFEKHRYRCNIIRDDTVNITCIG